MTNYIRICLWLTLMGLAIGELLDGQTTSMVRLITADDPCPDCPVITSTIHSIEPKDSSSKFIKYLATPQQQSSESIAWTTQTGEFEIDTCAAKASEVDAKMMYFSEGVCKTTNDVYTKKPPACPPTGSLMVYILKGAQDITTPANPDTTTPANPDTTTPASEDTTTPASEDTTTPASEDTTTPADPDTATPTDCEGFPEGSTMCLEAKDCSLVQGGACGPLDEETKQMILGMHNLGRSAIAFNDELNGDPGPQQAGTNIYELTWDDDLAKLASRWAENIGEEENDCVEPCRSTSKFPQTGQNVFTITDAAPITDINWPRALVAWYSEVENVKGDDFTSPSGKPISHYTQMVWGKTHTIGCGVYNSNADFCVSNNLPNQYCQKFVCNYGPAGNLPGEAPYSTTEPCVKSSTIYRGLCEKVAE